MVIVSTDQLVVQQFTIWNEINHLTQTKNEHIELPEPLNLEYRNPEIVSYSIDEGDFCRYTMNGTTHSRYIYSNPNGVPGLDDFHIANFDQKILNRTVNSVEVDLTSVAEINTNVAFPLDSNQFTPDISHYLLPEANVQSDNPEILALSKQIVTGASTEAIAVDRILTWVRGYITYDFTGSLPIDALSVLHNRSGVCAGFSTLTVALMRAAGIPSDMVSGCLADGSSGPNGMGSPHAWILAYYPDSGWIASEPQGSENYVDTSHIFGGLVQCGKNGTIISRIIPPPGDPGPKYNFLFGTRIDGLPPSRAIQAAQILDLDGFPPQQYPSDLLTKGITAMVTVSNPQAIINIRIKNQRCSNGGAIQWIITTAIPWLNPSENSGVFDNTTSGLKDGLAVFYLDASGLDLGKYQGQLTYMDEYHTRNLPITLSVVDQIFTIRLPLISNTH